MNLSTKPSWSVRLLFVKLLRNKIIYAENFHKTQNFRIPNNKSGKHLLVLTFVGVFWGIEFNERGRPFFRYFISEYDK